MGVEDKRGLCAWSARNPRETLRHIRLDGSSGTRIDLINGLGIFFPSERHKLLRALRYTAEELGHAEAGHYNLGLTPGALPIVGLDGRPLTVRIWHSAILPVTGYTYHPDMIEGLFCIEMAARTLARDLQFPEGLTGIGSGGGADVCSWCRKPADNLVPWKNGDRVCVPCTLEREG